VLVKFRKEHFLVPISVPCYDWKNDNRQSSRKTRENYAHPTLVESENGGIQVSWACSRAVSCRNQNCRTHTPTQITKAEWAQGSVHARRRREGFISFFPTNTSLSPSKREEFIFNIRRIGLFSRSSLQ